MMQDTHDSNYHVDMTTGDIGDTTAVHHVTGVPSCELGSVCNDKTTSSTGELLLIVCTE